jgi:hypothetical protein
MYIFTAINYFITFKLRTMKKLLFLSMCLGFLSLLPNKTQAQAHDKGDIILTPFIGLGNWGYYRGSYGFPVGLNVDFAVHKYADVGPYAGVVINGNYQAISFGARGNFNWWQLLDDKVSKDLKADKIDLYYTLGFGYEIFPGNRSTYWGRGSINRFRWSSAMGIRWYFAERIALMGEVGAPSLAPLHIGIAFKLNK